jgi:hypothetical protein
MRIESEFLTFSHYQTAQGSCFKSVKSESVVACELERVWLRKADELHMSVSVLREAIRNEFNLRQSAVQPEPESESEPKIKLKPTPAEKYANEQKQWEELPRWLNGQKPKLEELASARHCKPHEIVLRAVADFIDAHVDELGDAQAAEAKRKDEYKVSLDAAKAANDVLKEKAREHRNMIALIDEAHAEYRARRIEQEQDRRAAEQSARAEQEQAVQQATEQAILAEQEQAAIESDMVSFLL